MAEELGKLVSHVGGPAHAHVLLAPLESLTQVEETVVRDKAVESICVVGAQLTDDSVAERFVPLIKVGQWRGLGVGRFASEALAAAGACRHAALKPFGARPMWQRRARPCSKQRTGAPLTARPLCALLPQQRLAQGEWFTSRVASTGLFPIAYPRAPAATRSTASAPTTRARWSARCTTTNGGWRGWRERVVCVLCVERKSSVPGLLCIWL